jgi:hypothetical protein
MQSNFAMLPDNLFRACCQPGALRSLRGTKRSRRIISQNYAAHSISGKPDNREVKRRPLTGLSFYAYRHRQPWITSK